MLCCVSLWFDEEEFAFSNFGLRWNKSVYVLASASGLDKYSFAAPCTDLSLRLQLAFKGTPAAITRPLFCIHVRGSSQQRAALKMTFYSLTALPRLYSGHLCAETMTVHVACSAGCPGGTSSPCRGTITPAQRNEQRCSLDARLPGCPTPLLRHLPPPPPPLCSPRSGHKVLSYSHQTVWLEAAADVTVFVFGFVSSLPSFLPSPASCQRWLPGRLACEFFKSWKNVACEREVEALAPAPRELGSFLFSLPLQPKVQSKQSWSKRIHF